MNFLKIIESWFLKLIRCSPRIPVSISDLEKEPLDADCCEEECEPEEECCDHEDCEPAPEPIIEIHVKEEPTPVVVEEVEEPEPVEVVEEVSAAPAPVGELLRQILLAEGISEGVIGKYQIIETFEGWYDGPIDDASVRASIQDFKSAQGGVINAKLSRVQ